MSTSKDYYPFHILTAENQEFILNNLQANRKKLADYNFNMLAYIKAIAKHEAKKFINKTPIENPTLQYLGFLGYLHYCTKNDIKPEFKLEQFANLEKLHYPYDFYTLFINNKSLRNSPNIRCLQLAQNNCVETNLMDHLEKLSEEDKKFLEHYEVTNSLNPMNLLAGQYQLISAVTNEKLTGKEQVEKVKALIEKGIFFSLISLEIKFKLKSDVKRFLEPIERKNNYVYDIARSNKFTEKDLENLGKEGEAQINNSELLFYLLLRGNIELAKELIRKGCNIEGVESYNTLVTLNNIFENLDLFYILQEHNVNLNCVTFYFETILYESCESVVPLEFFIEKGINIESRNNYDETALECIAKHLNKDKNNDKIHVLKQAHINLAARYFIEGFIEHAIENLELVLKYSKNKDKKITTFENLVKEKVNFTEMDSRQKVEFNQKLSEFNKKLDYQQITK